MYFTCKSASWFLQTATAVFHFSKCPGSKTYSDRRIEASPNTISAFEPAPSNFSRVRSSTPSAGDRQPACRAGGISAHGKRRTGVEVIQKIYDLDGRPLEDQTQGLKNKTVLHLTDNRIARFDIRDAG